MTDMETGRRYCRRMRASLAAASSSAPLLIAAFAWDRDYDLVLGALGTMNLVRDAPREEPGPLDVAREW